MERPVIGLANGGTLEVVEHGRDGLLSVPGDVRGLADDLLALLRDPARREEMGRYGRRQVLERFTYDHLARAMAGTYAAVAR
jgi:glycogen synthase